MGPAPQRKRKLGCRPAMVVSDTMMQSEGPLTGSASLPVPVYDWDPDGPSIITWDLEIAIPVEEVPGGWDAVRHGAAGISTLCLHDTRTGRYHVYDEHTLSECIDHMNSADLLIGFNTIGFDTPVLECLTETTLIAPQYDILSEIWKALPSKTKGFKLSDVCLRLGLGSKSRTGASAPELLRAGHFGTLVDYCINDVHLTRKLANHIERMGYILTPDGDPLELSRPGVLA